VHLKLELPTQEFEQLAEIANVWQATVTEVAQSALSEWLAQQAQLKEARMLMRELGRGLGEGSAPYNTAREHDAFLYAQKEE
jgi:hypothetical protein